MKIIDEKAKQAVTAIIEDLSDRSGLGDSWSEIDEDIQAEIVAKWEKSVADAMREMKAHIV